jgi:hypothetical protein
MTLEIFKKMADKTKTTSELCSQAQCKEKSELQTASMPSAPSNENPMTVEASGMRGMTGKVVNQLNKWEDSIETAAPDFVGDALNELGLDGKPVLVLGIIGITLYAIYKFS